MIADANLASIIALSNRLLDFMAQLTHRGAECGIVLHIEKGKWR